MDDTIRHVLTAYRSWAVVGCSPDPSRDSHDIANLLERNGYEVARVNPRWDEAYPSLEAAAAERDIEVVDVFRHPTGPASTSTRRSRSGRRRCGSSSA